SKTPFAVRRKEQVFLELGQLVGAEKHLVAHQKRRLDLGVAVLRGVRVYHELAERTLEPGKLPLENSEAAAGELGGAFEIHQAKRFADVEMFLHPVRARLHLANLTQLDV